ncbi:hypothetical protein GOP47_0027572 [Adiantum capillus-veneris]|nr:hypothetical protein GOP47_0027572 [Adiantum capillus-veneris]
MKESFKRFRKRHLSNDPIITLFSCGKAVTHEEAVKHGPMKKEEDETQISNEAVLSHPGLEISSDNESVLTQHPMEPTEVDHPIRCPHPEPCIIQDGRALKERAPSMKRRGQLPFITESEVQRQRWNRRSAPSDCQIYPAASAPEHSLIVALP